MESVTNLKDELASESKVCRFRKAGERNRALESFIFAASNLAVIYTNTSDTSENGQSLPKSGLIRCLQGRLF